MFEYGRTRGYLWALFFISFKFLGSGGDVLILYIITLNFINFGLTIGTVTTLLLYCRTIIMNGGSLTNNIQQVAKVFGSAYDISKMIVTPNKVLFEGDII